MIETLLNSQVAVLAQFGLLGALFIGACIIIYIQGKQLREQAEARLEDYKKILEVVKNQTQATETWITTNQARQVSLDASTLSQQLATASQAEVARNVIVFKEDAMRGMMAMKDEIAGMRADLQKAREALIKKGVDV